MDDFDLTSPAVGPWPLLFRYRAPVLGNGFLALVELHGRLLARPESDGRVWLDGVNPGALAVEAPDLKTANLELHAELTAILADFAEVMGTFDTFKTEVERFFHETDADTVNEWKTSVSGIQRGEIVAPSDLPVCSAESPLRVDVTQKPIEQVTAQDNPVPEQALAAAA